MPRELAPNIFLIEVPLPGNPLKNLNVYLVRGRERSLLIDTGFLLEPCYQALKGGLDALGVDMERTDIFLTHLHADHSGLCGKIAGKNTGIYIHRTDHRILVHSKDGNSITRELVQSLGFSLEEMVQSGKDHPDLLFNPRDIARMQPVDAGHVFDVAPYRFQVIHTPGHTPGHCCLWEPDQGLLFAGDHVIFDITPNIGVWEELPNALEWYMGSLRMIRELPARLVFSSHRQPTGDLKTRVDALIGHHRRRLDEAIDILPDNPGLNSYQAASRMRWKIRARSWEEFPIPQRWFATVEAASHLEFLWARQRIHRHQAGGQLVYWRP